MICCKMNRGRVKVILLSVISLTAFTLITHQLGSQKDVKKENEMLDFIFLEEGFKARETPVINNIEDFVKPTDRTDTLDPSISDLAIQVSKAKSILKKVKVACFITTQIPMIETKLAAVNNTWSKRIDKIFYMVTLNNTSNFTFPNLMPVNISNDRQHLTEKTVYAFRYLYDNHLNDFDWFMKADDDTYVVVENLKYLLSHYNASKPIYLGHHFRHYSFNGYMSGGGAYVLSREALRLLIENGYNVPGRCRQHGGAEDIETGRCLTKAGALVYSSTDKHNRETFHPMNAYGYIIGPIPRWITGYSRNEAKEGKDCCSQLTITFHYTGPRLMAILDFLLYRMSVYGRQVDYGRLQDLFEAKTVPPPTKRFIPYFFETMDDYKNATVWKAKNNTVL